MGLKSKRVEIKIMSSISEWRLRNPHYCLGRFADECGSCGVKLSCDIHMGIKKFYDPYTKEWRSHIFCDKNRNWTKQRS